MGYKRRELSITRRRRHAAVLLVAAAVGAVGVSIALAAGPPTATTTAASKLAATTATLNGKVLPNEADTTYYFEYGTTTAYGTKTPQQGPITGKKAKNASAAIVGLTPATTYHFRVVASNAAGTANGNDLSFTTDASGSATNILTAAAAPKDVTFSRSTTVTGQLSGPNNAGVKVTLEENPAPYTGQFKATSATALTTATGAYSLAVTPVLNTQYRVVSGERRNQTTSAAFPVRVRVKVALRLSDRTPKAGQKVRFAGTVLPAHDGKVALIQRRAGAKWRTVARATLVTATPVNGVARSKFAKRLKIRNTSTYRVRVVPADNDHIAGVSRRRTAKVS